MEFIFDFILAIIVFAIIAGFIIDGFFSFFEYLGNALYGALGLNYASFYIWFVIIFGFLALVFYIASLRSYKDYKFKSLIHQVFHSLRNKEGQLMKSNNNNLPVKREIDMENISLKSLVGELQRVVTSPAPVFFKGWGNRRLELDIERVELMSDYIDAVAEAGQAFIHLKADALISYDKIQLLASAELATLRKSAREAEYSLGLLDSEHQLELSEINHKVISLNNDLEKQKLEIEKSKLEFLFKQNELQRESDNHNQDMRERDAELISNRNKNALEYHIMSLKANDESRLSGIKAVFYDNLIKELDLHNLTPSQVLIIINLFSNNSISSIEDFEKSRRIVDEEIRKMKEETEIKRQEARTKFWQNENLAFNFERNKTRNVF